MSPEATIWLAAFGPPIAVLLAAFGLAHFLVVRDRDGA